MRDGLRSRAIRKVIKRGGTTAVFQPVLTLTTATVARTEAFARLRSNDELLDAIAFVPLVDEDDAGTAVDVSIIRAVAERIARSPSYRGDRYVINLSAHSLLTDEGTNAIRRALARSSIDEGLISFDIRHDLASRAPGEVARAMTVLGAGGCGFAVESFDHDVDEIDGLAALPIECIKLARILTARAANDESARDRIARITARAHAAGLTVTGVGAEDHATVEALAIAGVDHASGHVFGQPAREPGDPPPLRSLVREGAVSLAG